MTIKTIYGSEAMHMTETLDLLSGICAADTRAPTTSIDRWQVGKGNGILVKLFEIACSALGEPSFSLKDWDAIKAMPRLLMERRLELADILQDRYKVAAKVIHDKMWKPSLETIIGMCFPNRSFQFSC